MHRFEWSDIATKELLNELREATGDNPKDDDLRPVIAAVLRHSGGLAIANSDWDKFHCTKVGKRLLSEALGAAHAARGRTMRLPGSDRDGDRIVAVKRIDVNSANARVLADLPIFGTQLAWRTLAERRRAGPFATVTELAERVSGLGPAGAARLAGLLSFETNGEPANLKDRLKDYLGDDGLMLGMERLAVQTAGAAHPASRQGRKRPELEPENAAGFPDLQKTGKVELLEDEAYLPRLLSLLESATSHIDVAMFYMSWGGEDHPTQRIAKALGAAKAKGAIVRVLLDRDQENDPYGSSIINADAVKAMTAMGLEVRQDSREKLLHSKCVAVDGKALLIGSHNWTRASFVEYRDVSVLIASEKLAETWHKRFNALWST